MKKTMILVIGLSEQLNIKIKNLSAEKVGRGVARRNYL